MGEGVPTYKIGGAASKNAFWGPGAPRDHLRSRWQPLPPPTLILKPAFGQSRGDFKQLRPSSGIGNMKRTQIVRVVPFLQASC